ncbi:MAG: TonB-dependent receptor [Gemmatimonadota bacterium]
MPLTVSAQAIRGTVVDGANVPVSGVVAQLLDSTSRVVARQLSDQQGGFRLSAPNSGTYRVRTLRIGFSPTLSEARVLRRGDDVPLRILLPGIRVALDTVHITARSSCRSTRDSAAATFAVWQQVRTALTATDITASNREILTTAVVYERTLDPLAKNILQHASVIRSGSAAQPWSSMTPDALGRDGYVSSDSAGSITYYAPGIDVLLSDRFLEDHCLEVATERARIGIRFEPVRERKEIPEIRGTVWLDRATLELRNMEYRYANIPSEQDLAGGTMEFAHLNDGAWAISRWNIRMPALEQRVTGELRVAGISIGGRTIRVREIVERGGELALARRGNDTLWSRPSLVFRGVVRDSLSGRALAGAYLTLDGTALASVADSVGRFSIAGLIAGEYVVAVHSASLDSVGAAHRVRLGVIDSSTATIDVPSADQFVNKVCGPTRMTGARAGIVVGGVKARVDSLSVSNLPVIAEWTDSIAGANRASTRTDADGAFRLCGLPLDAVVSLAAESRGEAMEPIAVRLPADRLLASVELAIDIPRGATLTGFVGADSATGKRPILNAEVALTDVGKSATTNDQGTFALAGIAPGTHRLVVRKLGYAPVEADVSFESNARVVRNVDMTRVTTLDSVRVVAQSRYMSSFEDHRQMGLGHFFTREDLAKKEGQSMSSIMRQVLGVLVLGRGAKQYVSTKRLGPSLNPTKANCYSRVYLDNQLVYAGGRLWQEDPFDINSVSPDKLEGVEIYTGPSQIPAKYAGPNTACGVVVLWTRRTY